MSPTRRQFIVPSASPRRTPAAGFKSSSLNGSHAGWEQHRLLNNKLSQYRLWMFIIAVGTLVNGLLSIVLIESFLGFNVSKSSGETGEPCSYPNCTTAAGVGGIGGTGAAGEGTGGGAAGVGRGQRQLAGYAFSEPLSRSSSLLVSSRAAKLRRMREREEEAMGQEDEEGLTENLSGGVESRGRAVEHGNGGSSDGRERDLREPGRAKGGNGESESGGVDGAQAMDSGFVNDTRRDSKGRVSRKMGDLNKEQERGKRRAEEKGSVGGPSGDEIMGWTRKDRVEHLRRLSASRTELLASLREMGWVVTPHSAVPGVFVLERPEDYSTALLVQDVCYLFMVGKSRVHNHYTGVWFSRETVAGNFSDLSNVKEGQRGGEAVETKDGGRTMGYSMGLEGVSASVVVRDLSQIDLSRNVCSVFKPRPEEDTTRLAIDALDLPVLVARANKSVGRMVGPGELREFVLGSSATARKKLRTGSEGVEERGIAVVGRYDSHVGHFGESAVAMLEAAQHLIRGGSEGLISAGQDGKENKGRALRGGGNVIKGSSEEVQVKGLFPPNVTLFFPSDKVLRSNWSVSIGQLLFGASSQALAGRLEGRPACFKFAMFLLNARHLNKSVELLHQRSWAMVGAARSMLRQDGTLRNDQLEPSSKASAGVLGSGQRKKSFLSIDDDNSVHLAQAAAAAEVKLVGEDQKLQRLAKLLYHYEPEPLRLNQAAMPKGVPPAGGATQYHVTVIEREGQRTVSNMGVVMEVVQRRFPHLPVEMVRFAEVSLIEQVAIMKHTVLMVSMHGASLSNVIFLSPGSTVVELFPYLFQSEAYMGICRRSGIFYLKWENQYIENSTYTNNCMEEHGYAKLSMSKCRHNRECLFCARDRSVTTVHEGEFDDTLRLAQEPVDRFLQRHQSAMQTNDAHPLL